jgi:hypothetical protein
MATLGDHSNDEITRLTQAVTERTENISSYGGIDTSGQAVTVGRGFSHGNRSILSAGFPLSDDQKEKMKQMREIWVMCECQRQMHRLAHMYYAHRQWHFNVLPLTVLTMLSGVMAFLSTADMIPNEFKEYLALSVGILSIFSASFQSMNQEARYDSKAEMHKNAALGMKRITDNIEFIQVDPNLSASVDALKQPKKTGESSEFESVPGVAKTPDEEESDDEDDENHHANLCQTFQEVYQQCLDSCQSQIPVQISQAFKMAEARLSMSLTREDKVTINENYGQKGKQIIYRCLYNEVFCAIADYRKFPKSVPRPETVVEKSMVLVEKCFQKKQINFFRKTEDETEKDSGCFGCLV